MIDTSAILWWVRRDMRTADNLLLAQAVATGRPLVPVFICDDAVEGLGAAPKWRLGLGLAAFGAALEKLGARLILRRGPALTVLRDLIAETGAGSVWWGRQYDDAAQARDSDVKSALRDAGLDARSFPGHLLFEPWTVKTGQGGFYRVYTPFWRAVAGREVDAPEPAPKRLIAPADWPASDALEDLRLGDAMQRGADVVAPHTNVGEALALDRLAHFTDGPIADYKAQRDLPAAPGTSRLSENLTYGEIGPRTIWHAGQRALAEGAAGAETFLKELVWREFAYHLMFHTPEILTRNWKPEWDSFPWQAEGPQIRRWQQGRTGVALVDAAMREMYVTGTMHNRGRMIVASYLTKHLMTHWRVGLDWFADCLIDWDPAANAMGWQWAAGSGPDASPYFRIFNPDTQAEKFDAKGVYRRRWLQTRGSGASDLALAFYDACPKAWGLSPDAPDPAPMISLSDGRARALEAYSARDRGK
ncbi:cryptochrome/photolyase family protein [Roseicitreum antarcticum]|uniref:Deoxyribodipyrimidine photo-lyase n=1 Tax=Roseicitreum antarcticum TaxID=564137 RepID=A0A1H2ZZI7_9RHOB|nr:deoxyribodipyrimidine photo-lyase [Roseicitreum antarcticum]SDX22601.1 deoxyribodipyrimidine photo-lyase [Roseicitreum antarcticum]